MASRIFKKMRLIILLTLISGFISVLLILYNYFASIQYQHMKTETALAAQAVEKEGLDYLSRLTVAGTRITWIAEDGTVLFDNEADASKMGNHASRPEVQEALENGGGEVTRYSKTLTTAMLYSAIRLNDGSVLRISETRQSVLLVALGMMPPMLWIFIVLLLVTWLVSARMAKHIVDPINKFDLDHPLENEEYPELAPFLHRIYEQQQEISRQKESLRRAEQDFVAVTDNMAEGFILLGTDGKILTINHQAIRLLHADQNCAGNDILTLERRTEFENALQDSLRGEHKELILDFSGRSYQIDISPIISDKDKKTAGMAVLMFDVTDREQAEQMRIEFTGNVSHELKTPLHTISGCAELLESGEVRPADQKKFIHTIYAQAQRMITLVQDILYISHLDEGAEDMKWEKVNLLEYAKKSAEQLQTEAAKKKVSVTVEGCESIICGISRLAESIIYNLIDNAIKYNRENGTVKVNIADQKDKYVFTVEDTGIGIPEEDIPRIFERFYCVDKSHSREIGGTGLGLSIVKHAAQTLHADLNVTSILGKGSKFTVAFPKKMPGKQ